MDGAEIQRDDAEFRGEATRSDAMSDAYARSAANTPPGEHPVDGVSMAEPTADVDDEAWLLQQAQEMYTFSSDYLESNITNTWEKNLSHFHSEHAPGSVYTRKGFKRSRVFRPKTRANTKQQESSLANALFSTVNLVSVTPEDERDKKQVLSAAISKHLLTYRLEHTVPWFLTTQGAYQNTKVYGLCISHQYWAYEEDTDIVPAMENGQIITEEDPETGEMVAMGYEETVVRRDELCCDLIEPENFRFDPMCDWRNPANTSPYLVIMNPIYISEALEMMEKVDPKTGMPTWRKYSAADLLATRKQAYNRTRQAREGRNRIDPADDQNDEFNTLWAHMNIRKINGTDMVWWTMGTELLLTDPIKLTDAYPWLREGERPFVVGFSTIEAHRNYPAGDVEQGGEIQEEINTVANQRLDNVKLVLNKRYYVKRGSQVDLDALVRNTPGGGVMMNDPEKDVVTINTPDVTGSSYTEQAALGSEYDELVGGFNPANSQQSSVGGISMAGSAANAVQDYGIKIFIETWAEPVLRQLIRLEQMYETDETLMGIAASKADMISFGYEQVTDDLIRQNLLTRIDVGMGNTDPMRRVERLVFATSKVAEIPGMAMRIKGHRVAEEIYGALGYRDSSAFIMTDEEWAEQLEANPEGPSEMDVKMRELDIRDEDNKMRDDRERLKIRVMGDSATRDSELREAQGLDALESKERVATQADATQRQNAAAADKTKRDSEALKAMQSTAQSNMNPAGGGT